MYHEDEWEGDYQIGLPRGNEPSLLVANVR